MQYKASLDTLAKVMTLGVFILFIAIGQMSVRGLLSANGDMTLILVHSSVLLLFVAILLGCWLYAPQSYTVDSTDLTINRPISKVKIKRADISQVRTVANGEMSGSIRTFGNGGLFGFYGKYYNSKIGHMTLYTTQTKNRVLIITKQGRKIIISPDDTSIVEKLKE